MKRYLSGNPIPWLLEEGNPEIRYLTLRDIVQVKPDGPELKEAYGALRFSAFAARHLAQREPAILGDQTHFDALYTGCMWRFAEAVLRGFDRREPAVADTAEFLFSRCQKQSGGFILNWNPEIEVACRTGDMLRFLMLAGYSDERIESGVEWIARTQREDGGWLHCPLAGFADFMKLLLFRRAGSGLEREGDGRVSSCVFASIACMNALLEYNHRHRRFDAAISRAAEYFLSHRMFVEPGKATMPPCCGMAMMRPELIGCPVISQYDVLYGLTAIARAGAFSDSRTGEAFNEIMSRQGSGGVWAYENFGAGMLYCRKRERERLERDKWATLNAVRLFKAAAIE